MRQYLEMIEHVMLSGENKQDRTGTGTKEVFGYQARYDLKQGFPLLTTKKMDNLFEKVFHELKWFIIGETNIRYLLSRGVNIWNADAYRWFKKNHGKEFPQMTMKHYIDLVKNDLEFAYDYGDLGRIYGAQWTDFGGRTEKTLVDSGMWNEEKRVYGINQLQEVIQHVRDVLAGNTTEARRLLIVAWNPNDKDGMALPPCHVLFQLYVHEDGRISGQLYQRSGDLFLGVPFNIASYSLLLHMIAHLVGAEAGEFVHTIGCLHLYNNHKDQAMIQLSREPMQLPALLINPDREITNIEDFEFEDFELIGYNSHGPLKGDVSVGK